MSCSQNVVMNYQTNSDNTGKLVLIPDSPLQRSTLTIDDNLVFTNKHIKSVTINNIPVGNRSINLIADGSMYKEKLKSSDTTLISNNKTTTKLIQTPPRSGGFWASKIISTVSTSFVSLVMFAYLVTNY
jgi:hypothetical protein